MMGTWGPLLALVPLWVVSVFAPGFLIVRRLRWGPVERLCAAVGVSLVLLYLGALVVFVSGLGRWAYWGMAAACVVAAAWGARDWVKLWRVWSARRAALLLVVMMVWGTVCLGLVRHYGGARWGGDWELHYQKLVLFLNGGTTDMSVVRSAVIDRPSMMNLITGYFAGVVGQRYDVFQLVFLWLNVLAVLPCCLLVTQFGRRGGRYVWVLAAMLACLPTLWANATYAWTKLLAAFYVLLGIWLYLRAVEKGDRVRMVAAALSFAAGMLAHYVALPYAVVTFVHYVLLVWWRRRGRWAEVGLVIVCSGGLLLTWFGWATVRYGVENMVAANNTLREAGAESAGQFWTKVGRNFVWNVVPHPLRSVQPEYVQPNWQGQLRDYMFLLYQMNLPLVSGSVMGIVAARLAGRRLFRRNTWKVASTEAWFWRGLVVFLPIASALALDVPSQMGAAHLFSHPWAMMAVTLVAANVWRLPAAVRWLVATGMVADFMLGVFLHFHLQNFTFGEAVQGGVDSKGISLFVVWNWVVKENHGLVFLGDRMAPVAGVLEVVLMFGGLAAAAWVGMGYLGRRAGRDDAQGNRI